MITMDEAYRITIHLIELPVGSRVGHWVKMAPNDLFYISEESYFNLQTFKIDHASTIVYEDTE